MRKKIALETRGRCGIKLSYIQLLYIQNRAKNIKDCVTEGLIGNKTLVGKRTSVLDTYAALSGKAVFC